MAMSESPELAQATLTLARVADELGCTRDQLDLWFARGVVAERDGLRSQLAGLVAWRGKFLAQARRAIVDADRFRRIYDPEQPDLGIVIDTVLDDRDALRARVDELESFVVDLAFHGTRHDLNPTMNMADVDVLYTGMSDYLRSMDETIRRRAKALLPEKETKADE
jgi:hypothetical protein